MKNIIKICGLILFFVSLVLGTYLLSTNKGTPPVIEVTATIDRFDNALLTGLIQLNTKSTYAKYGYVKINLDGNEIVARVPLRELKQLISGEIAYSQFIRSSLKFS